MDLISVHNKDQIAAFLRRNTPLNIYAFGDLDDFFWPYTIWYALQAGPDIGALALMYIATSVPTLLAHTDPPHSTLTARLLRDITHLLPSHIYAHLSQDLPEALAGAYEIELHGTHAKMALADRSRLDNINTSAVIHLSTDDAQEIVDFYTACYPGNWFDPRMLATGFYYGIRHGDQLVCCSGVHVVSQRYRVAALGNILTHPAYRGQGLASAATAKLCQALAPVVDHIGLNVKVDNAAAITCYTRLGFERVALYEECTLRRRC